ncbi:MAG: Sensor diguanylate cyclase, PAS domain-containing [Desulfotomaculum sp. 46_296]|nr:MAG: Sensor diguanylate cyclase, PAS domain-containing [Desulfotomaculum sp. 46_296]HAU31003.1 sensor domain-containing diguanylate cyclase [Desulfotomaculum sp.]
MEKINYLEILDCLYDGVYFVDLNRKITFWNKAAEKITGFTKQQVIGTHCHESLLKHINKNGSLLCVDTCSLAQSIKEGKEKEAEVFVHHREGHRVPVLVHVSPVRNSFGVIIGAVENFSENSLKSNLLDQLEKYRNLSLVDPLTDLLNRRYLEVYLQNKINELKVYQYSFFGVLFIDIDYFKNVNDSFGHDIGDNVLKMVSKTLKNSLGNDEVVCRWGGEEFIAVVQCNSLYSLFSKADMFRFLVKQSFVPVNGKIVSVTISVGAAMANPNDTVESLVKRSDTLIQQSKSLGRNRVSIEESFK